MQGARVQPWENMVICGSEIVDLEGFFTKIRGFRGRHQQKKKSVQSPRCQQENQNHKNTL